MIWKLSEKIEKLAGWCILLAGWRRHLVAFVAGAISALAMPPFDLVFVMFFTFPVLVWLLDGAASEPAAGLVRKLWEAFKPGFYFGFGYFTAGLWWIGNALLVDAENFVWALPFAVIAVPAVLAVFWGVATACSRLFWHSDARRLFILAAAFALFEFLRGIVATGFPWNAVSYAAYVSPVFMQSASVLGIYGMTAFAVFVFSSAGVIVPGSSKRASGRKFVFGLSVLLVFAHTGYGMFRLPNDPSPLVNDVRLRLMQPAINQREKFSPEKEAEIFRTYLDLSTSTGESGKQGLSGVTHLIWPESAFPFLLTERRDALAAIAAMLPEETTLVTGAARAESAATGSHGGFVFNSVYLVDHKGEVISAADKTHLVPFGEYLPFQGFAESLGLQQLTKQQGGFEPGSSRKLLSTGKGPQFLPLICYEIIFSDDVWNSRTRPGWIVNLTNDAWFGNTPGPYQHLRQSVLRGVEEGLPVVRVANTGISGVFDAYGRVLNRLELGTKGIIDTGLPTALKPTLFVLHGGMIQFGIMVLFFAIGLFPLRK